MKFLTRENAGPLAADEHHRQAFKRYREHLETQRSKMSDPIQKLAFELNFHDARLKRVEKVGRTIEVAGVLGDLQVGYQTFFNSISRGGFGCVRGVEGADCLAEERSLA